jgi:hypothetical protein
MADPTCPACGEPLYGWLEVGDTLLQRCESCGLGVAAGTTQEDAVRSLARSLTANAGGELELRAANRRSVQAGLGARHWAALDPRLRDLYPTPAALRLLAGHAGIEIGGLRSARWGRAYGWMWQTLVNSFTFSENFALRVLRREVAPRSGGQRVIVAVDALVTVLAGPLVAIVAMPLELIGALAGRGGELVARVREPGPSGGG